MCHWCATTPKEESALPSPGCLITYQVAHIATRSQGSYPIASQTSEVCLLTLLAITIGLNPAKPPLSGRLSQKRLSNFPDR